MAGTKTVFNMNNKIKSLIHYAALGHTSREISEILVYTVGRVHEIMRDDKVQAMIETKRHQLFENNIEKRLNKTAMKAFDTAEEIMLNPETKSDTRLSAAQDFMDRALGKAIQRIDNAANPSIRDLFEALDKAGIGLKEKRESELKVLNVEPKQTFSKLENGKSPLTSTDSDPTPNQLETTDPIEDWLEEEL